MALLQPLAAVQSDGFGVLPDAHQAKPEIGFAAALREMKRNHLLAEDSEGDCGYDGRVSEQKDHQAIGDRPQHAAERRKLKEPVREHENKRERLLAESEDVV